MPKIVNRQIPMRSSCDGYKHLLVLICICLLSACINREKNTSIPEKIDFNFHVRPILSNNCFLCHGPDPSSREADLRLDEERYATARTKHGSRPIVPRKAKASEVFKRITSHDPDMQMPPPETNKQLSPQEIAILKKWINQGAEWRPYWAFIPPKDIKPDCTKYPHPVDNYLKAARQALGISASSKTDQNTLIRSLSYQLTGLPPSVQDINYFVNNQDTSAYEQLVDRYLESPKYGERWARHWMDLARYAEGKGHEFDYPIVGAWQYRDYLIRAFNQDVPYDLFIKEQLAGDLIPSPRKHSDSGFNESVLGTTFLVMAEGKHSPVDIKEEEKIMIDNVIDVTTKTFQGLTVACARCHDHKFDPIPTSDYYAMYGIFESMRHTMLPARSTPEHQVLRDSIDALKKAIKTLLAEEIAHKEIAPKALPISLSHETENGMNKPVILGDFRTGSREGWIQSGYAFGGKNQLGEPIINDQEEIIRLSKGLVSSRHYGTGVAGALRSPTFIINKPFLVVRAAGNQSMIRLVVENFQLIQDPIYGGLDHEVNSAEPKDYVIDLKMVQGNKAYIELLPGHMVRIDGKFHYYNLPRDAWIEASYAIMFDSQFQRPILVDGLVHDPEEALAAWIEGKINTARQKWIASALAKIKPNLEIWGLMRQSRNLGKRLYDSTFVAGITEGDRILSPVFIRGDHKNPSPEKVPHHFLSALPGDHTPFSKTPSGRLELAEVIADTTNPLTARVMVNRIWHHLFGRGIVESVDNFGLQGTIPTHPKLLDHLAVKFMNDGWSVKKMIRYLVTTQAFKQSTTLDSINHGIDPLNNYLHCYPVKRLEAEAIRDGILATSGNLDTIMFGISTPIHLTSFLSGRGRPPRSGPLDGNGRRSIYLSMWRNFLPPMMTTFDMPIPFSTFGKRMVTNVPGQSLTLLNDPFMIQQAEQWAQRILELPLSTNEKVNQIYLEAFSRDAKPAEIKECLDFLMVQKEQYGLTNNNLQDFRLWRDLCHGVFNMKEFIYLL